MAKKHTRLPKGVNYAQVLAEEKRKKDAIKQAEKEAEIRINSEIYTQRMTWIMVASIADAYGFGAKRLAPFFEKLRENAEEFERMERENDYEYALEKLRQKVERVTGEKIEYLYEKELRELEKRKEGQDVYGTV